MRSGFWIDRAAVDEQREVEDAVLNAQFRILGRAGSRAVHGQLGASG
jgi:hypothetical protein